jgi:hypothetical protein
MSVTVSERIAAQFGLGPGAREAAAEAKKRQRDKLPELTQYRDDGCDIHPQCLTCPLPRCRYDDPGGLRGLLNSMRDEQIVAQRRQGTPISELAQRFGVSRRTVFRVLENAAREGRKRRVEETIPVFLRDGAGGSAARCA